MFIMLTCSVCYWRVWHAHGTCPLPPVQRKSRIRSSFAETITNNFQATIGGHNHQAVAGVTRATEMED